MKIVIIIDNLIAGGAEKQAVITTKVLKDHGCEVKLISYGSMNFFANYIEEHNLDFIQITARGRFRIARILELIKVLKQEKPDIVYTFKGTTNIFGRVAAKIAKVPHIFAGCRGIQKTIYFNTILNKGTEGWIVNCDYLKKHLIEDHKIRDDLVFIVPNAVDEKAGNCRCSRSEARVEFNLPREVFVISIVASLRPVKNHYMFLRVAKKLVDRGVNARFVVAGEGDLRVELEEIASDYGLKDHVLFLGRCDKVPVLLRATDLTVHTSITEGLCNAILEAGSAGIPCVSSDNGGAGEILIDGKTGFIVPVDDDDAMVEKVQLLIDNNELRMKMGSCAKEHIRKNFSEQSMGDELLEIFNRTIEKKTGLSEHEGAEG